MSNQSEKTLRDLETLYHEIFNLNLEPDLTLKLVPYVIKIYQNNSEQIGSPQYLSEQIGLQNIPSNLDEASFIKYVVEHESQHLLKVLELIVRPDLPMGSNMLDIISTMENYFLSSLTFLRGTRIQINFTSGTGPEQFRFRCKTPEGSEFWIQYFSPTSQSNFELEHALLKKYEGICFLYVTWKQRTKVPNFIGTDDQSQGKITLTTSRIPDLPLNSWMNVTYPQRRNFERTTEQIHYQIQVCRGLFEVLKAFLSAELTNCVLLPRQTLIRDVLTFFPIVQFDPSIISFEWETKSCSQFDQVFTSGNTPNKTTFCIGLIMLYCLSATAEEDFHNLAHEFTTIKNERDLKVEIIAKYAPIIAASKSLMNLIHRLIHSTYSSHQITNLFIDWNAFKEDFENEECQNTPFDTKERLKLFVYPVGRGIMQDLFLELINLPLTMSSLGQLVDNLFNQEDILPNVEPKNSLNLENILSYVKNKRPWLTADLILDLEIHFSPQLLTKLSNSISTHWLKEIQHFSYHGVGEHGYLFQKEEDVSTMPEFRSRVMLLLPKPGGNTKVVSKMFTTIKLNLSVDHYHHFYDRIDQRTVYSEELYSYISSSSYLPRDVIDLIQSGYYVEFWLIQYRSGRTNLQDYLTNYNSQVANSFTFDIIKSLFDSIAVYQNLNIHLPMLSPENVFFVDWKSSNRGKFKLPVFIDDQSLITLASEREMSNLTLTEIPTITYKFGLLILQLLFPQNFQSGSEELLDQIEIMYPNHHDLSCTLRKMMFPSSTESLSLEHFDNLEITSIGLKMPPKRPPFVPRDEQDVMKLINDGENQDIVANVVALMYDDIIALTTRSNTTHASWQETLDHMLINERSDDYGHFEELENNREKFEEISNVLEMIKIKSLKKGGMWLDQIFFVYGAFDDAEFREKLTPTIKSVWLETILSDIELLGYGAFGLVFQTRDEIVKEYRCAAKLIVPSNDEGEDQNVMREVENMRDLIHPNVLHMTKHAQEVLLTEADFKVLLNYDHHIPDDMTESDISSSVDSVTMQTEKLILRCRLAPVPCCLIKMNLAGPTLRQFLTETFNLRKNPETKMGRHQLAICRDLVRGMKYLQSKKILHCDLKPDNILFTAFGTPINQFEEDFQEKFILPVQIADFGLSSTLDGNINEFSASRRGNLRYHAPERETTFSSEIYSIGLIIFEVLVPCVGAELRNLTCKLASNSTQNFNADEIAVQEFILGLTSFLQKDAKDRMSVQDFQMFDLDWVHIHNFFPDRVQKILQEMTGYLQGVK
ncbi:uncharacterized protein LOC118437839 [Folsomia candida]|uniref:uncharacterized protein LOC118437839 n=1 Tax=Folsomia candida TaxID=158441 RepID=UPI001604DD87|nr:uncharacterized protein LOC118437839 [Folsomia candida]